MTDRDIEFLTASGASQFEKAMAGAQSAALRDVVAIMGYGAAYRSFCRDVAIYMKPTAEPGFIDFSINRHTSRE